MGRQYIEGFLEMGMKQEEALRIHLQYNHYPPIPLSMMKVCQNAIKNANEGNWNKSVRLPEGILYKGRYKNAPTSDIIESHHLDSFLDPGDDFIPYDEDEEE